MVTYALCGFANFSSIAIQIGGLGPLAPDRKSDIAGLGMKAVSGGAMATLMTATLAGLLFINKLIIQSLQLLMKTDSHLIQITY